MSGAVLIAMSLIGSGCASTHSECSESSSHSYEIIDGLKSEVDRLNEQFGLARQSALAFEEAETRFHSRFQKEMASGGILIHRDSRGLIFVIPESALFAAGEISLLATGESLLRKISTILIHDFPDNRVFVDAHADDRLPLQSAYASYWDLTCRRSEQVIRFFRSKGVRPGQMVASGYGEFHSFKIADRLIRGRMEVILSPEEV